MMDENATAEEDEQAASPPRKYKTKGERELEKRVDHLGGGRNTWRRPRMTPYEKHRLACNPRRRRYVVVQRSSIMDAADVFEKVEAEKVMDEEARKAADALRQLRATTTVAEPKPGEGRLDGFFEKVPVRVLSRLEEKNICTMALPQRPVRRGRSATYRRANHCREKLLQIQGAQRALVPQDVIDAVRAEAQKYRLEQPTMAQVRRMLRDLGLHKYYEQCMAILAQGFQMECPQLNHMQMELIQRRFNEIEVPFEKHKPKGRQNMTSYNFVLHKICELLGYDNLLPFLPMLKSRQKLQEADMLWRKICKELNWQYVPTLTVDLANDKARAASEALKRSRQRDDEGEDAREPNSDEENPGKRRRS